MPFMSIVVLIAFYFGYLNVMKAESHNNTFVGYQYHYGIKHLSFI